MSIKKYKPYRPKGRQLYTQHWDHHGQSRHERGYDTAWDKTRNAYIEENPVCELCLQKKVKEIKKAEQVDHIIPFKGFDDPLRLDWSNLQSVCVPCHRRKEAIYRKRKDGNR